eukprot:scaffold202179_cov75-Attheya_sp.AAC.2
MMVTFSNSLATARSPRHSPINRPLEMPLYAMAGLGIQHHDAGSLPTACIWYRWWQRALEYSVGSHSRMSKQFYLHSFAIRGEIFHDAAMHVIFSMGLHYLLGPKNDDLGRISDEIETQPLNDRDILVIH